MHISRLAPPASFLSSPGAPPVEWRVAPGLTAYAEAVAEMEARAAAIAEGRAAERVWLVEHPPLYTAGTSAQGRRSHRRALSRASHRARRPVHLSRARPARRLCDARPQAPAPRRPRLRRRAGALADRCAGGVRRRRRNARGPRRRLGRAGPTSRRGSGGAAAEDKIAAIGIRVRRWVSFHGVAAQRRAGPDAFPGIVPCGVAQAHYGVTSLRDLGSPRRWRRSMRRCIRRSRRGSGRRNRCDLEASLRRS